MVNLTFDVVYKSHLDIREIIFWFTKDTNMFVGNIYLALLL